MFAPEAVLPPVQGWGGGTCSWRTWLASPGNHAVLVRSGATGTSVLTLWSAPLSFISAEVSFCVCLAASSGACKRYSSFNICTESYVDGVLFVSPLTTYVWRRVQAWGRAGGILVMPQSLASGSLQSGGHANNAKVGVITTQRSLGPGLRR